MAPNPQTTFEPDLVRLAELAKALSHPGRLRILQILADCGTCICGEVVQRMPLAQSTVSQHLRELKKVGLISGEIEGPRTCYCLDQAAAAEAYAALGRLFSGIGCCPSQDSDFTL